jgi:D-glycero-D-manno-heptose 1,7-bisphosphate phosphatase
MSSYMRSTGPLHSSQPVKGVLWDRDGTLIEDVPYNADPALVRPMPGARRGVDRLRTAGIRLAVVSNQSGVALGRFDEAQLAGVNAAVEAQLGRFDVWEHCPHAPKAGCACRKPQPGMLLSACRRLNARPEDVVMVGDIGSDIEAARAAGIRAILVPRPQTRPEEIARARWVVDDLNAAVDLILAGLS